MTVTLGECDVLQVVTSIPTKGLPKSLTIGSGEVQDTPGLLSGEYEDPETHEKRSGQILWIRGLTRLQTQVGVSYIVV
jgi:Ca2+ transporting ATPase